MSSQETFKSSFDILEKRKSMRTYRKKTVFTDDQRKQVWALFIEGRKRNNIVKETGVKTFLLARMITEMLKEFDETGHIIGVTN